MTEKQAQKSYLKEFATKRSVIKSLNWLLGWSVRKGG